MTMNHSELGRITGVRYNYQLLDFYFEKTKISRFRQKMLRHYSKITKKWDDNMNAEWIARMYLAGKMIYSATLLLNTSDYCNTKNVVLTDPYLFYYALFCCCRALNFTDPTIDWRDGAIINDKHLKVINNTASFVSRIDTNEAGELKDFIIDAKDFRELFSYKFPSDGYQCSPHHSHINIWSVKKICTLLCEIAQKSSEIFQSSFEKHCGEKKFGINENILESCITYTGHNYEFDDDEDSMRMGYIDRKVNRPFNIQLTMSEGLTDQFFGAWHNKCGNDDFNPDHRSINIFDLP